MLRDTTLLIVTLFVLLAPGAGFASTTFIDFNCGVGHLDLKTSGAGDLTASGNRGVFTGANTTKLSNGMGGQETSGGTVTATMFGFNPASVEPGGLGMFITDGSTTITATVTDVGDTGFPKVTLTDGGSNTDEVEFLGPNSGTNFMTLVYNAGTDVVTLTIVGFGGDVATLTGIAMGDIAVGVSATGSQANFDGISIAGPGIPLFPPIFDAANPWVDFNAPPCGNGAQTYPFNMLSDGVSAASPAATISIQPGTSSETMTITDNLSLTNATPGGGSVEVGVIMAREAEETAPRSGFVSRGRARE